MRTFLSLFAAGMILFSCGEAGLQIGVGKLTEIAFEVNGDLQIIPGSTSFSYVDSENVDIAESDFSQYKEDLKSVEINFMRLKFEDYDGDATFSLDLNATNGVGQIINFPSTTIVNGQEIDIFPGNVSPTAIPAMENLIKDGNQFQMNVDAQFDGDIDQQFTLVFLVDISAVAQAD